MSTRANCVAGNGTRGCMFLLYQLRHDVCQPHEREVPTKKSPGRSHCCYRGCWYERCPLSPMLGHALVPRVVNRQQSSPQEARGEDQHHKLGKYLINRRAYRNKSPLDIVIRTPSIPECVTKCNALTSHCNQAYLKKERRGNKSFSKKWGFPLQNVLPPLSLRAKKRQLHNIYMSCLDLATIGATRERPPYGTVRAGCAPHGSRWDWCQKIVKMPKQVTWYSARRTVPLPHVTGVEAQHVPCVIYNTKNTGRRRKLRGFVRHGSFGPLFSLPPGHSTWYSMVAPLVIMGTIPMEMLTLMAMKRRPIRRWAVR